MAGTPSSFLAAGFRLTRLHVLEQGIELLETRFPELPVALGPIGEFLQRRWIETVDESSPAFFRD
jgi:hypothetical protein